LPAGNGTTNFMGLSGYFDSSLALTFAPMAAAIVMTAIFKSGLSMDVSSCKKLCELFFDGVELDGSHVDFMKDLGSVLPYSGGMATYCGGRAMELHRNTRHDQI